MPENKTSGRKVQAVERRAMAIELRKAGLSYQQIADQIGVSRPAVFKMVTKVLRELNEKTAETAEEVRRLELERLDEWLIRVAQEIKSGNVLPAIDRGLRIMDRRASLLGLDAPRRNEITGRAGGPIELAAARARLEAALERRRRAAELYGPDEAKRPELQS